MTGSVLCVPVFQGEIATTGKKNKMKECLLRPVNHDGYKSRKKKKKKKSAGGDIRSKKKEQKKEEEES